MAVAGCWLFLWSIPFGERANGFNLVGFLFGGTLAWIGITVAALSSAWPVVLASTWIGQRLRLESVVFYASAGGFTTAAMLLLLVGLPRWDPTAFVVTDTRYLWAIGVSCSVSWGIWWWYLHRRWMAGQAGRQTPR